MPRGQMAWEKNIDKNKTKQNKSDKIKVKQTKWQTLVSSYYFFSLL